MDHRRPPSTLVDRLRRLVRRGLEVIGSLDPVAESGAYTERIVDGESTPETRHRATDRSVSGGVTDPETGPTSRGEILEYRLLPAACVRAVVTEHGGRVKQCRFTDEYGWSSSTISRLLSELEDRDVIERYRIARREITDRPSRGRCEY